MSISFFFLVSTDIRSILSFKYEIEEITNVTAIRTRIASIIYPEETTSSPSAAAIVA